MACWAITHLLMIFLSFGDFPASHAWLPTGIPVYGGFSSVVTYASGQPRSQGYGGDANARRGKETMEGDGDGCQSTIFWDLLLGWGKSQKRSSGIWFREVEVPRLLLQCPAAHWCSGQLLEVKHLGLKGLGTGERGLIHGVLVSLSTFFFLIGEISIL